VIPPPPEPFVDATVAELGRFLRAGDLIVVNDTRVIPAKLDGIRRRGNAKATVAVTLHTNLGGGRWRAFAKPGRRLAVGDELVFASRSGGADERLIAIVEEKGETDVTLHFQAAKGSGRGGAESARCDRLPLDDIGAMPLPPYIAARRAADAADRTDYQTVYAAREGSVAAPTAGLHFTPELFARLDAAGIKRAELTLHVGPGTFLPVRTDAVEDHVMHAERGTISAEAAATINAARAAGGRILAVGTTALRLIESAAYAGGEVAPYDGETDIFITPGYRFRAVDLLMTNFHLPRSTLFMLVAAFAGLERMRAAYDHAIRTGYRFYSYGDASLLHRADR
jgi:S-adenosylmethionine:tRNA ribosyltransferase-isomerase